MKKMSSKLTEKRGKKSYHIILESLQKCHSLLKSAFLKQRGKSLDKLGIMVLYLLEDQTWGRLFILWNTCDLHSGFKNNKYVCLLLPVRRGPQALM